MHDQLRINSVITHLIDMLACAELHDRVTMEDCAAACFAANQSVAGVLGGNHCSCGGEPALATAAAAARKRPIGECQAANCSMRYGDGCACTGNPSEHCGGVDRMLAYSFSCESVPGTGASAV